MVLVRPDLSSTRPQRKGMKRILQSCNIPMRNFGPSTDSRVERHHDQPDPQRPTRRLRVRRDETDEHRRRNPLVQMEGLNYLGPHAKFGPSENHFSANQTYV